MSSGYITKTDSNDYLLDLSLGTNPSGPSPKLLECLKNKDLVDIINKASNYSPEVFEKTIKELIINAFKIKGIDHTSVELNANGSYQLGDEMIRMFKQMGMNEVLIPNYSFPNVSQRCQRHGIKYTPVEGESISPKDSLIEIQNIKDLNGKMIYIDYPHNPTGSFDEELTLNTMDYVSKNGGTIILDMAYGEVLPNISKVIQKCIDTGGVVLGSLSKTQGLPDLRAGWGLISPNIVKSNYHGDERMVFNLSSINRLIYETLFKENKKGSTLSLEHAKQSAEYNSKVNEKLYEILSKNGLEILDTSLVTPIQTIHDPSGGLYEKMLKAGINVENLNEWQVTLSEGQKKKGYKNNAVRMITPKEEDLELLENLIKKM